MQILNTKRRAIYIIVAVLIVSLFIGSTVLLLVQKMHAPARHPVLSKLASPTSATDADSVDVKEDGLEMSMRVTPGPYFLGELVLVHLALINHTHPTLKLAGQTTPTFCSGSSLFATQTGGTSPHYIPYTMPIPLVSFGTCSRFIGEGPILAPGQTVTSQTYLLLTNSGSVTLACKVFFLLSVTGPENELDPEIGPDPFAGHLPTLLLHVTPQVPAGRILVTQQEGSEVVIQGPSAMQLVVQNYIICQDAQHLPWPSGFGHTLWQPLSTNVLPRPDCAGNTVTFALWKYAVGAEGYEVVQGQQRHSRIKE